MSTQETNNYRAKRENLIARMKAELDELCEMSVEIAEQYKRGSQCAIVEKAEQYKQGSQQSHTFQLDMDAICMKASALVEHYIAEVNAWD